MGIFISKYGSNTGKNGLTFVTIRHGPDICCNRSKIKYRLEGNNFVKRIIRSGPSNDWNRTCNFF